MTQLLLLLHPPIPSPAPYSMAIEAVKRWAAAQQQQRDADPRLPSSGAAATASSHLPPPALSPDLWADLLQARVEVSPHLPLHRVEVALIQGGCGVIKGGRDRWAGYFIRSYPGGTCAVHTGGRRGR